MSRPFWLRPLRLLEKPQESMAQSALDGEPLDILLRRGAACLLESVHADRAGVWASNASGDHLWHGQISHSDSLGSGFESCNVNAFEVFPVEFTDANSPVEFFAPVFPVGPHQFFEGISIAVGMSLKVDDRILGALLAGSAKPGKLAGRDVVESVAAEIGVSLYAHQARERQESMCRALHLHEEVDRLIADGAATKSVLKRILSAAVNETGAQFAGVARRIDSSLEWEVLVGNEPRSSLQPAFFEIATAVFLEGESIVRDISDAVHTLSLIGLPLDGAAHEPVVLLAGYPSGERLPFESLEGFRAMITVARCTSVARDANSASHPLFEKMAALGRLAPGIAHELNNPLTSIMGYAQLLLHKAEGRHEEVKLIFDEAERARRIVKNLLSFTRPVTDERARSNINEIIERTIALRGYELKAQNIELQSELDAHLPETLADPHQLQQLVLNLLINAEQAVAENSSQPKIHLRTRQISSGKLAIEISDNGPGVPPEIATRIFDPFFTTKPAGVGTGLGLPIVRSIAEQQGGKVFFENLPQRGAKFTVELPIVPVPEGESCPADIGAIEIGKKLPSARILIVEDEPTVAHLVADVLREDGHRVEAVLDSEEALLRAMRANYDLIICDLRMPRVDGPAFYDALVRAQHTSRHRILFITGDTLGPHTLEFLQSHQLHYLAKPFLVEELKLAAYRVLEENAAHSPETTRAQAHR